MSVRKYRLRRTNTESAARPTPQLTYADTAAAPRAIMTSHLVARSEGLLLTP